MRISYLLIEKWVSNLEMIATRKLSKAKKLKDKDL